jgi:Zinc dependent phospholipase C
MPTPIQHLVIADDVLADPALPSAARASLAEQRDAFLFGAIAPDVQSVSGQTREATHFFALPPPSPPEKRGAGGDLWTDTRPAHQVMFAWYPMLVRAAELSPARAAFVAGYISHLALDELWIANVFGPHFGLEAEWGTFRERLLIHNVLRTWLDQRDQSRLNNGISESLTRVEPQGWLPFVGDEYLRVWRDLIAEELRPGATVRTVEVFAQRLHVPPAEFLRVLESPGEMQRQVFSHLPPRCVEKFYADAQEASVRSIMEYLGGR